MHVLALYRDGRQAEALRAYEEVRLVLAEELGLEPSTELRRLQREMVKLPRNLSRKDIGAIESRMRALGGTNVPLPKGPMPKSAKIPRGKMR